MKAFQATVEVFKETAKSSYSDETAVLYIGWACRLLVNGMTGKTFEYGALLDHGPCLLKKSRIIPIPDFASRADPIAFSSFLQFLPHMPVLKANDAEKLGYELDVLLGLNCSPPTEKTANGSLTAYIPDALTIGALLYKKGGAEELLSLESSVVHLTAVSGMIKGLMAHHVDNYLIKGGKVYEIDLEECLLPYNRVPSREPLAPHLTKKALPNLILARMAILGLPQCAKPFDRALLLLLTHPSLLTLTKVFASTAPPFCRKALLQRISTLQRLARRELRKKTITATPRDFYFALFGGKHLYELAHSKGYPDIVIFNQVVSDPYQRTIKNFMKPVFKRFSPPLKQKILHQNLLQLG